jgi:hypothetical protein
MIPAIVVSMLISHILIMIISARLTAKAIYQDIKVNYDVIESVRIIEEKRSRANHPTARPQFYDWETEEKFEDIIENFDN